MVRHVGESGKVVPVSQRDGERCFETRFVEVWKSSSRFARLKLGRRYPAVYTHIRTDTALLQHVMSSGRVLSHLDITTHSMIPFCRHESLQQAADGDHVTLVITPVSYTHLTLPTKRIV